MHRLLIAAAAASVLALGASAHAGGYGDYSGGWSSAPPCGCQGYADEGGYSYQSPYVDEDDGYYSGDQSYDYVPYETPSYGYDNYAYDSYGYGDQGYGDQGYDYGRSYGYRDEGHDRGRSYYATPRYRSHSYAYQRPRTYSYRSYGYSAPHYSRPHYTAPTYRSRSYGHSSTDGERG